MEWETKNQKMRLDIIGAVIMAVGLISSLLIYLSAEDVPESVLGNQLEDSKAYVHALELYGGTANFLASEFTQWFSQFWHGKPLAFTVALISIALSLVFFFLAHDPGFDHGSDD